MIYCSSNSLIIIDESCEWLKTSLYKYKVLNCAFGISLSSDVLNCSNPAVLNLIEYDSESKVQRWFSFRDCFILPPSFSYYSNASALFYVIKSAICSLVNFLTGFCSCVDRCSLASGNGFFENSVWCLNLVLVSVEGCNRERMLDSI